MFDWLQKRGHIEDAEMHRTFNCGIGMAIVVARSDVAATLETLAAQGVEAYEIGSIVERGRASPRRWSSEGRHPHLRPRQQHAIDPRGEDGA